MFEKKEELVQQFTSKIKKLIDTPNVLVISIDIETKYMTPLKMGGYYKDVYYHDRRNQIYQTDRWINSVIKDLIQDIKSYSFISWGTNGDYLIKYNKLSATPINPNYALLEDYPSVSVLISGEQYRYIQKQLSDHYNPNEIQ